MSRWALSRVVIIDEVITTAASRDRVATVVQNHFAPIIDGAPVLPWALVQLGTLRAAPLADTLLLPDLASDASMKPTHRASVIALLDLLGPYEAKHPKEHVVRGAAVDRLSTVQTFGDVVSAIFWHLGHSIHREGRKPFVSEHNTEFLDNFTTDTSSDWQPWSSSTWTHDAANGERTVPWGNSGGPKAFRYQVNTAGSLDHEAQVSGKLIAPFRARLGMAAVRVRFDVTSERDAYFLDVHTRFPSVDLSRANNAVVTNLLNLFAEPAGYAIDSEEWLTFRLAASGAVGANVLLHMWAQTEASTTKPADPGWVGVDASPQWTNTDSSVDRLDDAIHAHCGIANTVNGSSSTADAKYDYFKLRALTDRGGVVVTLAGQADGVGTLTGNLALDITLAGQADGVGTLTGDLTAPVADTTLAGQADGVGTMIGDLVGGTMDMSLGGTADGVGTLSGNLIVSAPVVPGVGGSVLTLDLEGLQGDATMRLSDILTLPVPCP